MSYGSLDAADVLGSFSVTLLVPLALRETVEPFLSKHLGWRVGLRDDHARFFAEECWAYEAQNSVKTEEETVDTEERLMIDTSRRDSMLSRAQEVALILDAWGVPHEILVEDPTGSNASQRFGLGLVEGDSGLARRGWSAENELSRDALEEAIENADSLEALRELLQEARAESSPPCSFAASAARLPEGFAATAAPQVAVFRELRSAASEHANRYASKKPSALQVAALVAECPPNLWRDSLGEPCAHRLWHTVSSLFWELAHDELPAQTRLFVLEQESRKLLVRGGVSSAERFCQWIERADAFRRENPDLWADSALPARAIKALREARHDKLAPELEARVLKASLALDLLAQDPASEPREALSRPAARL
jgi:hypothetical protein